MGMDENVGSIWGEPRGTTMVDQNLNLEQTNYFHLFIDNKAYPNEKKSNVVDLNSHQFIQLEKLMKFSHRVVQLKNGPKPFVGAELLGLQPLCQNNRGIILGPEPCEFQMGWPKKLSIQRLFHNYIFFQKLNVQIIVANMFYVIKWVPFINFLLTP